MPLIVKTIWKYMIEACNIKATFEHDDHNLNKNKSKGNNGLLGREIRIRRVVKDVPEQALINHPTLRRQTCAAVEDGLNYSATTTWAATLAAAYTTYYVPLQRS